MTLDCKIWGPKYWFVFYTIALNYPLNPNEVSKKIYYNLVQNIPIFIPEKELSKVFKSFIDLYPVTPYLDSRESFIKWVHFIHNKYNNTLNLKETTLEEEMLLYYEEYKPKEVKSIIERKRREKFVFILIICIIIFIGYIYR